MTVGDLLKKVIIPLAIDGYFIGYFFVTLSDQMTYDNFIIFWLRFLLVVIAIPTLYVMKALDHFGVLHPASATLVQGKLFYWFVYIMLGTFVVPEILANMISTLF